MNTLSTSTNVGFGQAASQFFSHSMLKVVGQFLLVALLMALCSGAMAQGVPEVQLPAEAQNGGLIGTMRWIVGVVILLAALGLAGYSFINVGGAVMTKFRDYSNGREELGGVISTAVMGIAMLALVLVMAAGGVAVIPVTIA